MIPKIIHYCWFGKGPLDKKTKKCMKSWKKYFPDFEIREWNEENFDISMFTYTEQAYQAKKWAFVSDVARLYALHTCGGVYFDTDVEVVRPFEALLTGNTIFGLETLESPATCVMIASQGDSLIAELLEDYRQRKFFEDDGTYNYTPNPKYLGEKLLARGFSLHNIEEQVGHVICLPIDRFSPYDYAGHPVNYTTNTYSIHHFSATWLPKYRIEDKKKLRSFWRIATTKIKKFFERVENKIIRIIDCVNPLLGEIFRECGLRKWESYRLSKRYGGKIFVYRNCHVSISPTAIVEINGVLKIGLTWDEFEFEKTNFIIGDGATLLVKGNFRIFNGSRVAVNKGAKLVLGNDSFLNLRGNIRCFDKIVIGNGVRISENCTISDSDNHLINYDGRVNPIHAPIVFKDECLVGLNCTVLKGVTVEKGSVVAAGAVVTRDVQAYTLVGGVPARVIKKNIEWR